MLKYLSIPLYVLMAYSAASWAYPRYPEVYLAVCFGIIVWRLNHPHVVTPHTTQEK